MKMQIPAIRSVVELTETARKWGLSGYSRMKKTELVKLLSRGLKSRSMAELVMLARQWGLKGYSNLRKSELTAKLSAQLKKISKGRSTASAKRTGKSKKAAKKPAKKTRRTSRASPARSARRPASGKKPVSRIDTRNDSLPDSYADGRMILLPRDPNWLYCYWDPTPGQLDRISKWGVCALRVVGVKNGLDRIVKILPVPVDARSWYIQVEASADDFRVELGLLDEGESFEIVMVSNPSSTPPDSVSDRLEASFASHLTSETIDPEPGTASIEGQRTAKLHAMSLGDPATGMDSAEAHESRLGADAMSSADIRQGRSPGEDSR